jgi:two-component system response regulator HydG
MHASQAVQPAATRILLVDDDVDTCSMMEQLLGEHDFVVTSAGSAEAALDVVAAADFDAVLTDVHLPGIDGIELCRRLRASTPDLPVLVLTGDASMDIAIAALRSGAYDFVTKPVAVDLLIPAILRAAQQHRLAIEVKTLRSSLSDSRRLGAIVGSSPSMRKVFDLITRVAATDIAVLVTGESGTGKELVARAIHSQSARASGPFVAVNCAAVPPSLIESELFGHVAGAFTSASGARRGMFAEATGGTLFLDEIGELPLAMQPKLLRALQEREIRPVGSDTDLAFDARIITATNRDLAADVEAGTFREDLLYRIDVVQVELPPLRARGRDVLLLAQSFLERFAKRSGTAAQRIDIGVAQRLLDYDWPGNVRELENCIERAIAVARHETITVDDLPDKIRDHQSHDVLLADGASELPTLDELARRYILRVLAATAGNKARAAKILGLDRRTLSRRLEEVTLGAGVAPSAENQPPSA